MHITLVAAALVLLISFYNINNYQGDWKATNSQKNMLLNYTDLCFKQKWLKQKV